jgi:hypothetical protein
MPFRIRSVLPWDGRGLGTASLSDCLEKVGTAKVLPGCQKRGSEIGKAFPVPRCHWLCPHGYQGPQSHPLEYLYRESHAVWIIGYFLPGLASPDPNIETKAGPATRSQREQTPCPSGSDQYYHGMGGGWARHRCQIAWKKSGQPKSFRGAKNGGPK